MNDCDLAGRGVLVTRPSSQAAGLSRLIESHGGCPIEFPALLIAPAQDSEKALALLRQRHDLVIFISPNAVRYAQDLLAGAAIDTGHLCAVGAGTAKAMSEAGYAVDLMPTDRFDSEGLLALPELLQIDRQKVLIVRGEGGRAFLGDTLRARGAKVGYAEVYRRVRPESDCSKLLREWSSKIDLVTVTSGEMMDNLVAMLGEDGWPLLRSTPLLVVSKRVYGLADERGFETVILAAGADDASMVSAICDWFGVAERY